MSDAPERLDLQSLDIAEEKRQELLDIFPEVRTEDGKIDFERLKLALGETVDAGRERYGMTWPGKADCFKTIQSPSLGTLRPCPEESVNFDTTENLIIEGDNLEVLKLLQKSYLGKVKMIYIDPPYNTGNDFIYPDNFSESLQTYLEYTGQVDTEGRKFGTNTDSDGRFHTKWLNTLHTRLYLARNLLRDDGALFISIDDRELDNLRKLVAEIYGEENALATFVWQKKYSRDNRPTVGTVHEYIVLVTKNSESFARARNLLPPSEESTRVYRNPNNDPRGRWRPVPLTAQAGHATASQFYEIVSPSGVVHTPPEGRCWGVSEDTFKQMRAQGRIWFGKDGSSQPNLIRYLTEIEGFVPWTWLPSTEVGHTDEAMKELYSLLGKDADFETPKPTRLLRHFVQIATNAAEDELVLDFFAGTGTMADSLLQQNKHDGGNRKFILVQLPEPTGGGNYSTIAEITKERVRRVIKKLDEEETGKLPAGLPQDRGFRVFKLAESNFTPWNASLPEDPDALVSQLELHVDHIRDDRTQDDLLYEILLKSGFPLTTKVEPLTMEGRTVYSVADSALFICLERELTLELIRAMAARRPERVVCLDEGFAGNDQLKTNAVLIFRDKGVAAFKTV